MRRAGGWPLALGVGLVALGVGVAALVGRQDGAVVGPGLVKVAILDVGQGDSILIRSPEGKTALVDAGPSGHVVSLLKEHGVTTLDLVVISHHHADHYGGMIEVVKAFRPRVFLASNSPHTSAHYLKLLELVRDQGTQAIGPTGGPRKIELGTVTLTIFPQAPDDPHEENNNSVGVRLQYGGFSVLLPGDAEKHERAWWEENARSLCADCTVLKLAHHGSRNGTDAAWLELVRPRLAVVSLGKDNEFGHPHRETLAVLDRLKIPLLRTDLDGTIEIESDGTHWDVPTPGHAARGPTHVTAVRPHARASTRSRVTASGRIDVNTASEDELRTIPGIGPVLARRIIAHRPYRTVDDLGQLDGIGKVKLSEIRAHVTVGRE